MTIRAIAIVLLIVGCSTDQSTNEQGNLKSADNVDSIEYRNKNLNIFDVLEDEKNYPDDKYVKVICKNGQEKYPTVKKLRDPEVEVCPSSEMIQVTDLKITSSSPIKNPNTNSITFPRPRIDFNGKAYPVCLQGSRYFCKRFDAYPYAINTSRSGNLENWCVEFGSGGDIMEISYLVTLEVITCGAF